MKQIIEKIQSLYTDLVGKNAQVAEQVIRLNESSKKNDEATELLDKANENIKIRETAVRVIEDVQALSEETKVAQEQLKKDKGQLGIEKNAFEDYQAQEKQTHTNLKASMESSIKVANEKVEKYDKLLVELEEKKKNLVDEVTKEILNKK